MREPNESVKEAFYFENKAKEYIYNLTLLVFFSYVHTLTRRLCFCLQFNVFARYQISILASDLCREPINLTDIKSYHRQTKEHENRPISLHFKRRLNAF